MRRAHVKAVKATRLSHAPWAWTAVYVCGVELVEVEASCLGASASASAYRCGAMQCAVQCDEGGAGAGRGDSQNAALVTGTCCW